MLVAKARPEITAQGGKFLRVIDGEVSPELEGKVLMQQTGDSAHSRSTVP
ncbi:hypothetical protein [Burkholderia cepacia]